MRVEVDMSEEQQLTVCRWWPAAPDFVIETLTAQLEAARAIWPELKEYEIVRQGWTFDALCDNRVIGEATATRVARDAAHRQTLPWDHTRHDR